MKRVIVAFVAGALVVASGQAFADSISKIGKKVDSEATVVFNGESIGTAVILEGKSYAPLRDVANSIGAKIAYQKGTININFESDESGKLAVEISQKKTEIASVEYQINKLKTVSIPALEDKINHPEKYDIDPKRFANNQEAARKSKELLEAQLVELNQELEKLNAELEQLLKESAG